MTRQGTILGTASYMAPEQAKGHPVDKRADIWAFDCVLFEMLSGRRLFDGSASARRSRPSSRTRLTGHWLPAGTPSAVGRLLARCLEKDPRRRRHDLNDARLDIDDAVASGGSDSSSVGGRAVADRPRVRQRVAWVLIARDLTEVSKFIEFVTNYDPAMTP